MQIAIIKYGMGNVASVQKALKKLKYQSIITDDISEIKNADVLLLPGVGSFKQGMENLHNSGLVSVLTEEVINNKKPFIGICLGMQLIATYGNEPEKVKGLGWIDGEVIKIEKQPQLRVPHLGWNTVSITTENDLYKDVNKQDVYFIHSYHFEATHKNDVSLTVNYGNDLVAGIAKDNIHAMQFHPEKSQEVGLDLLNNILKQYA